MQIKANILLIICMVTTGCAPVSWKIYPSNSPGFNVADSCVRSVSDFEGVKGITKANLYVIAGDLERYVIETDYGFVHLDIKEKTSINISEKSFSAQDVELYFVGAGNTPPKEVKEHGKGFLDNLSSRLQKLCGSQR